MTALLHPAVAIAAEAHHDAEEILLYTTADAGPDDLLARGMPDQHRVMAALIRTIQRATEPMAAAIAAGPPGRALRPGHRHEA